MYVVYQAYDDNTAEILDIGSYGRKLMTEQELIIFGNKHDVLGLSVSGHKINYITAYNCLSFSSEEEANEYIKYNKENGFVKVTIDKFEDRVEVAVRDNGIGISPEEQERVFERFYRVNKSHSKEIGGTGLGLSIVKHGVAFLNAEYHIESALGEGTRIRIVFKNELRKN